MVKEQKPRKMLGRVPQRFCPDISSYCGAVSRGDQREEVLLGIAHLFVAGVPNLEVLSGDDKGTVRVKPAVELRGIRPPGA